LTGCWPTLGESETAYRRKEHGKPTEYDTAAAQAKTEGESTKALMGSLEMRYDDVQKRLAEETKGIGLEGYNPMAWGGLDPARRRQRQAGGWRGASDARKLDVC